MKPCPFPSTKEKAPAQFDKTKRSHRKPPMGAFVGWEDFNVTIRTAPTVGEGFQPSL